ncbi:MAG TPA: tripartite tricarboxylate transporter substrate-binding protein [Xanthobacteraceae bacterium]
MKWMIWLLSLATAVAMSPSARADAVADFYRGRTVYMVIGYGAGGGYDLYGRIAAEFLGKHIPGNPTIVPQNMPGAGSFKAAQYLYSAAPKDGTYLGSVAQTLAMDTAMGDKGGLDATKLPYLGRLTSNIDLGVALLKTGIKSFEDARARQYAVGTTGGASTAVLLPASLNAYAGAKFKLVKGYQGAADVLLALERGEVDVGGAIGIPNLLTRHPDWLKGGATILYQAALKRHRLLPEVPTLPELGLTDEGKAVLRAIASTAEIGRSILTTPGVPPERLSALRKAFADMTRDPEFLATCEKRNITLDVGSGEAMDAIVQETMQTPKPVLSKIQGLLNL